MINEVVKINSLTLKGKNKINEGLGKMVVIVSEDDKYPAFNNEPAYMIAPQEDPTCDSKNSIWIRQNNDKDFIIVGMYGKIN
jgi:hypothetical protein